MVDELLKEANLTSWDPVISFLQAYEVAMIFLSMLMNSTLRKMVTSLSYLQPR